MPKKKPETHFPALKRIDINNYRELVGNETVDRILEKARILNGKKLIHINSTYSGGGVAELLTSLVLIMNGVGIKADWRLLFGSADFFSATKKFHNALQGHPLHMTELKKDIYEQTIHENAIRMDLDADYVVVHDPQPLFLIQHYRKTCPWIWRCHLDLTQPEPTIWNYLKTTINRYDATIFTQKPPVKLNIPSRYFQPAIDPFITKNMPLPEAQILERLQHYKIPTDLPIVTQISRFDLWKDPLGVIQAYKKAREEVDCTLVLLGDMATDDPEGQEVYESLLHEQNERIIILAKQDTALVNALQSRAHVVLQKSIREGFGLTVTEAMWKGAVVIGGNVGGIPLQIQNEHNGFLVNSVDEAAARIVQVLKDGNLRTQMGQAARESVKNNFLMTRLLEDWLDLALDFEVQFKLRSPDRGKGFHFFHREE
ncbi:MAG: glycosyltransferase [Nitrospinaceae bacterium]